MYIYVCVCMYVHVIVCAQQAPATYTINNPKVIGCNDKIVYDQTASGRRRRTCRPFYSALYSY